MKKFYINRKDAYLCGVCAGLADYFNIDVTIVRIIIFMICMYSGLGIILYFITALISPTK